MEYWKRLEEFSAGGAGGDVFVLARIAGHSSITSPYATSTRRPTRSTAYSQRRTLGSHKIGHAHIHTRNAETGAEERFLGDTA
jgi:hypothetical protein